MPSLRVKLWEAEASSALRFFVLLSFLISSPLQATPVVYPLSYSARLTDDSGVPLEGPVDVDVKFFATASSTTLLGQNFLFTGVSLSQGVLSLSINMMDSQVATVFGDGTEVVFIEITAGGKTYPRQRFSFVPLALRVPIDTKTLSFDGNGKLGISLKTQPGANEFLTKNADGELTWGSPATPTASSIQGKFVSSTTPTAGQVLTYTGTQWVPQTPVVGNGSGTMSVGKGGTGATSFTNNGVLVGAGAGPISATSAGTQENILKVGTSGPEFGKVNLASNAAVTGMLSLTNGGTGSDLSATGGSGQYVKQSASGATLTVGTIEPADVTTALGLMLATATASGTGPEWSSSNNTHTLTIPMASNTGVLAGLLSNGDYSTFASKVGSISAGTGIIAVPSGSSVTVGLDTVGTSGEFAKVTTDAYGRVVSGSTLTTSDLPPLTAMVGADGNVAGQAGAVPAPAQTDDTKFLRGDGTWSSPPATAGGSASEIQYNSAGLLTGSSNFVYAAGNVGVGTNSPTQTLEVAQGNIGLRDLSDPDMGWYLSADSKNLNIMANPNWNSNMRWSALSMNWSDSIVAVSGSGKSSIHDYNSTKGLLVEALDTDEYFSPITVNHTNNQSSISTYSPGILLKSARDNWGSPVKNGDEIGFITASTRGTSDWGHSAAVRMYAAENQTDSSRGSKIGIFTTPIGTSNLNEAMSIAPSGNVGIGSASPAGKLDVAGSICLSGANCITSWPAGSVTSVTAGTGLTGGPITSAGTISLANTAVTPGAYTRSNITVDAQGRLTAAANGSNVSLTTEVSGVLPIANGGTGASTATNAFNSLSPLTTLGDLLYGGASGAGTRLAGNTTTTKQFLTSTGSGSAANAPSWATLSASDLPAHSAALITSGALGAANGGTGATTLAANNVLLGNGTGALLTVAPGASGNVLTSDGTTWTSAASVSNWTTSGSNVYRSSGNVGIGATAPTAVLDIRGGANEALKIDRDNVGGNKFVHFTYSNQTGDYGSIGMRPSALEYVIGPAVASMGFTGGQVGVGTYYPHSTFDVVGSVAIGSYAGGPSAPTNGMIVSGNVGIGTTSPGATLDVNGTVKITGGAPGVGKVLTSDANGLASWTTPLSGTVTSVGISAPAAGITVTSGNPVTSSGNITLALANDLNAVESLATTGLAKRTATDTWTTITDNSTNWDSAYTDRLKWDGGATGLVAANGRTSLGLGSLATLSSVGSTEITDNSITNADISTAAAISDSKLATISTAGKVSGSAITSGTIGGTTAISTSGTITTSGNIGIGTTNPSAKLQVNGQISASQYIVTSGATVDFNNGNVQLLQAPGGTVITLSNMIDGGAYSVVISDATSRVYTFSGCTTAKFLPANSATTANTTSIYTILKMTVSSTVTCYINWSTGY